MTPTPTPTPTPSNASLEGLDRDGHVTGLGFDRLLYGEAGEVASLEGHLAKCARCAATLASMRADDASLVIPLPTAAVRAAVSPRARARRVAVTFGGMVALAAAALLVVRPFEPDASNLPSDGFRARGGGFVDLTVHVHDGKSSRTVQSGAKVKPGDKARFELLLARGGFVMVVGMDDSADPYACWPQEEDPAAVYLPASDVPVVLPTAIEFDESAGAEHIFALWCEYPFHLGDLSPAMTASLFALIATPPPGCSLARVDLQKVGP